MKVLGMNVICGGIRLSTCVPPIVKNIELWYCTVHAGDRSTNTISSTKSWSLNVSAQALHRATYCSMYL